MADNMGNNTITSANCILTITIPGLFDSPVRIEQFATDTMLTVAQNNPAVAQKGVDGHTSFGWVPTNKEVTIALAADSVSLEVFNSWANTQETAREVYLCNAEFTMESIRRKVTGTRGALTTYQTNPNAQQTLQNTTFVITFDKWVSTPL